MKRAKQRYRSALYNLVEGMKMVSLKQWIRENYKSFGKDVQFSPKLERIVLS